MIARRSGADWRRKLRQMGREKALETEILEGSVYDGDSTDMQNSLAGTPREGEQ